MAGTGGVYNDALPSAADLPMEETRTREEVRARLEAKRTKVTTPWGNRPVRTEAVSPRTSTEYVVDETTVERFVTPELTDRPARPARAARPTPPVAAPTSTEEPTCPATPSSSPRSATPTPPSTSPSLPSARPSATPAAPTTRSPKPSAPAESPATPTEQRSPASTTPATASSQPSSPTSSTTSSSAPETTAPRSAPTSPATAPSPSSPRPTTTRTPAKDAASIVEGYLTGRTITQLAATYSTTAARIRRILTATDGLVLRDDRTTNSGGKPHDYPAEQVAAVRRLYLDERLTQAQVADELRTTTKVVANIMARHGIEARPSAIAADSTHNTPGRPSTLAAYRSELDAAGITPSDLRTWAREHGIEVPITGLPPRHVFHTYLASQASDEPQPTPTPLPTTPALADLFAELTKTLGDLVVAIDRLAPTTPNQEQNR